MFRRIHLNACKRSMSNQGYSATQRGNHLNPVRADGKISSPLYRLKRSHLHHDLRNGSVFTPHTTIRTLSRWVGTLYEFHDVIHICTKYICSYVKRTGYILYKLQDSSYATKLGKMLKIAPFLMDDKQRTGQNRTIPA